jgi:hypothetical protein
MGIDTARRRERAMFIGEVEEVGTIEPLVVPELLPEQEHERHDRGTTPEPEPVLEPAARVPARA